jgi:Subtilase family
VKKSILVVIGTILAIFFASIRGNGQGETGLGLKPDGSIPPFFGSTVQVSGCVQVGLDCAKGELLAILNKPKFLSLSPNAVTMLINNFLAKTKLNTIGINIKSVTPYDLMAPSNPPLDKEKPYEVCGQYLIRVKFMPEDRVEDAIQVVADALKNGKNTSLVNKSTVHGIQPNGYGRPPQSSTSDDNPLLPLQDATSRIERTILAPFPDISPVTVAVLDTGWLTHDVLEVASKVNVSKKLAWDISDLDNSIPQYISSSVKLPAFDNFVYPKGSVSTPTSGTFDPGIGHGTPVASIIGSTDPQIGVAPNAQIVPIKICNDGGLCSEASAIYGACYAMSSQVKASVINMSFAGRIKVDKITKEPLIPPIFQALVNDAGRSGSLVVASVGNSRSEAYVNADPTHLSNDPLYPAIISSGYNLKSASSGVSAPSLVMLSVGSVYTHGEYSTFATSNSSLDISAPGSWLKVLGKDGTVKDPNKTNYNVEGTSFSAAYVSGAAALLVGKKPGFYTAHQLAQKIVSAPNNLGCKVKDKYDCGAGLLDVNKAWNSTP